MLLYIMLYILLAYLMLIAALSNAICVMLFIFMLCLGLLTHSLFISCIICIIHSAFNLLVFPNSMFTPLLFLLMKGLCALRRSST